jgi:hypothetical protein
MALEIPGWLAQRGGRVRLSSDRSTWFVVLGEEPRYSLSPVPVAGQYGCAIKQTHNGVRVESPGSYPTPDEALRHGLEDLRRALGWDE